jgi:hypothetical protein
LTFSFEPAQITKAFVLSERAIVKLEGATLIINIAVRFFVLVNIWSIYLRFSASSLAVMAAWESFSQSYINGPNGV